MKNIFADSEIINVALIPGCYLLWKDNQIIYVGQSENIFRRVGQHMTSKDFDGFSFIEVTKGSLNDTEAELIVKHNPPINYVLPHNNKYIPVLDYQKHRLKDNAQPVWKHYYSVNDIKETIQYFEKSLRDEHGNCVCAECNYGQKEIWRPCSIDGFCPQCGKKSKVEFDLVIDISHTGSQIKVTRKELTNDQMQINSR